MTSNTSNNTPEAVQNVLNKAHYVDQTEDAPGNYGTPLVLNNVFDLLVIMIEMLQKTAAAQANRLNFLTAWQQAYTTEMNEIHAFIANNGDESQANPPTGEVFLRAILYLTLPFRAQLVFVKT